MDGQFSKETAICTSPRRWPGEQQPQTVDKWTTPCWWISTQCRNNSLCWAWSPRGRGLDTMIFWWRIRSCGPEREAQGILRCGQTVNQTILGVTRTALSLQTRLERGTMAAATRPTFPFAKQVRSKGKRKPGMERKRGNENCEVKFGRNWKYLNRTWYPQQTRLMLFHCYPTKAGTSAHGLNSTTRTCLRNACLLPQFTVHSVRLSSWSRFAAGWGWFVNGEANPKKEHDRFGVEDGVQANKNTPFRRPSCQAREEKRKFSPTATSLRRRRQRSRTWATAQRALAEERKWRPKVHQARRDDRLSSRFLSLLLTAAIVPTRPTPLLLCSPLPLSLSDQVWCIQRCDCVNCT